MLTNAENWGIKIVTLDGEEEEEEEERERERERERGEKERERTNILFRLPQDNENTYV